MQVSNGSRGTSAPVEALEAVSQGDTSQGGRLIRWLWAHPGVARLPPEVRDDVVQSVGLSLLERSAWLLERLWEDPAQGNRHRDPDQRLASYVGTMLRNRAWDQLRVADRHHAEIIEIGIAPLPEIRLDLARIAEALEAARMWVARRSSPLRVQTLEQMWRLARGDTSLEQLIDAENGSPGSRGGADWERARDRLYKRHGRARGALLRALEVLQAEGRLCETSARQAAVAVETWLRQRSGEGSQIAVCSVEDATPFVEAVA